MVEMIHPIGLLTAYLLDFLLGDPEWSFHPIRILGKVIAYLEKMLRMLTHHALSEKIVGILICNRIVAQDCPNDFQENAPLVPGG